MGRFGPFLFYVPVLGGRASVGEVSYCITIRRPESGSSDLIAAPKRPCYQVLPVSLWLGRFIGSVSLGDFRAGLDYWR